MLIYAHLFDTNLLLHNFTLVYLIYNIVKNRILIPLTYSRDQLQFHQTLHIVTAQIILTSVDKLQSNTKYISQHNIRIQ